MGCKSYGVLEVPLNVTSVIGYWSLQNFTPDLDDGWDDDIPF